MSEQAATAVCSCANPEQWWEMSCPVHGDEVSRRLAEQGAVVHQPPPDPEPPEVEEEPEEAELPEKRSWWTPLKTMTHLAEQAVVMDAWGATRRQICDELGVAPTTVTGWRKSPIYIERYREEKMIAIEQMRDRFFSDKMQALEGMEQAREVLMDMLKATDPDGRPLLGVRLEAAKVLAADKARTSEYDTRGKVEVEAKVAVGAVIHVHEGAQPATEPPVIEGQVVAVEEGEVVDDGADR